MIANIQNLPETQSETQFDEVAIATFKDFQIAVLTTTHSVKRTIGSIVFPVSERQYANKGWLVSDRQITATLDGLEIGAIFADTSPFKPIQRLSAAIPISFEVHTRQSLPQQITQHAMLTCQLQGEAHPYHSIFRKITPRFVRIYPFLGIHHLIFAVNQFLAEETIFITQHSHCLKQVPFYQHYFNL